MYFALAQIVVTKILQERVALLSEINAIWQNEFQNNENVDQLQLLMDNTIKVKPPVTSLNFTGILLMSNDE
jgi:hypothetical protein